MEEKLVVTITDEGFIKSTPVKDYRKQSRGGKGILGMKLALKSGWVVGATVATLQDDVMVFTAKGLAINTSVSDTRVTGRCVMGVRAIRIAKGDHVVGIITVKN